MALLIIPFMPPFPGSSELPISNSSVSENSSDIASRLTADAW